MQNGPPQPQESPKFIFWSFWAYLGHLGPLWGVGGLYDVGLLRGGDRSYHKKYENEIDEEIK